LLAKIIGEIKAEQTKHALEAVKFVPGEGKDLTFHYGLRVGFHAGLEEALAIIDRALKLQDKDID
jgi:hypothetical protein